MSDQQDTSASSASVSPVDVKREVADALFLLDYAVANGAKTRDGTLLPDGIGAALKTSAEKLGLVGGGAGGNLTAAEWAAFEDAYYDLTTALAPITAETLRNTQSKPYQERTWYEHIIGDCPALRFTRLLWLLTFFFCRFCHYFELVPERDGSGRRYRQLSRLAHVLRSADAVGLWRARRLRLSTALGACLHLSRSFDVHHKPEYLNRILLGAVAGGAVLLFVDHLTNDEGQVIQLSSAALGFLAGYNTDFLFTAIERVSAAILPKVGIDTVQKAKPVIDSVDLNDLAERMDKAQGADKEMYRALIARLTGTRTPPSGS